MFDIKNTTSVKPKISFEKIKVNILGSKYELSLVLMGDTLATRLNKEHKKKDGPTNILSFPLSETEGEIFLNLRRAQRDAKKFDQSIKEHTTFLFIHGALHLKGLVHGEKMGEEESRLLKKFSHS